MNTKEIKEIVWIGSFCEDLRIFPEMVKDAIGYALYRAQEGKKHHKSKPLKGFNGIFEIVNFYQKDSYRAVYTVKLGNKIYVLHTFKKKSKKGIKTPEPDIELRNRNLINVT